MGVRTGRAIELDDDETPNDRITWLVRNLFEGKQREAARAFGISQAVVSKIVRGEQVVGQRVLAAVAAHPRVNSQWLYTGEGQRLLPVEGELPHPSTPDAPAAEVGPSLPVAVKFLSGSPADSPLSLTRMRMPVAHPDFARTRYIAVLPENAPILLAKGEKVASGDYLMLESNRRLWADDPLSLNGKLLVMRLSGDHGPDLVLARGGSQVEGDYLPLDDFGITKRNVKLAIGGPARVGSAMHQGRQGNAIESGDDPVAADTLLAVEPSSPGTTGRQPVGAASTPVPPPAGRASRKPESLQKEGDLIVHINDIASVCVMLIRSF